MGDVTSEGLGRRRRRRNDKKTEEKEEEEEQQSNERKTVTRQKRPKRCISKGLLYESLLVEY